MVRHMKGGRVNSFQLVALPLLYSQLLLGTKRCLFISQFIFNPCTVQCRSLMKDNKEDSLFDSAYVSLCRASSALLALPPSLSSSSSILAFGPRASEDISNIPLVTVIPSGLPC